MRSSSWRATSVPDAGLVHQYSSPQRLCERRVTDDVVELDLLGIKQLQPQVVVAVPPVENKARGEEAELVQLGRRLVQIGHRHQVDVRVDDVDMPREQVAHSPLQGR